GLQLARPSLCRELIRADGTGASVADPRRAFGLLGGAPNINKKNRAKLVAQRGRPKDLAHRGLPGRRPSFDGLDRQGGDQAAPDRCDLYQHAHSTRVLYRQYRGMGPDRRADSGATKLGGRARAPAVPPCRRPDIPAVAPIARPAETAVIASRQVRGRSERSSVPPLRGAAPGQSARCASDLPHSARSRRKEAGRCLRAKAGRARNPPSRDRCRGEKVRQPKGAVALTSGSSLPSAARAPSWMNAGPPKYMHSSKSKRCRDSAVGPMTQPKRKPAIACDFERLETTIVRSAICGNDHGLM